MPAAIPPGARVAYRQQYRRCGKPDCPTCTAGGTGHGPYWYASWWADGHMHSRYIGKTLLPDGVQTSSAPAEPDVDPPATKTNRVGKAAAAEGLRVRSLGGFAVRRGAEQIPAELWTRRKLLASLFKQLLCADGWRLPREQLMESLWPGAEPATAAKNLRYTVFLLRRMLDAPDATSSYLRWEGEMLALRPALDAEPAEDWLDALAFARAARRALAASAPEACTAALQLYGGEFLPDELYDEWAEQQRADLRRLYLELLVHQATLCERQGDPDRATACLRTVLGSDPCHEASARALMRIHAAAGRHLEAIRIYQQLEEALQRDLSLRPDEETQALYAQVLAGRQAGDRQHTNLPSPLTSFVGRKRELAMLSHLLAGVPAEPAASGEPPRLVSITGSGGCGKTRLAIQLGHTLRDRYAEGVWLIELAGLLPDQDMDPALLAQHACTVLGIKAEPGQSPLATLSEWLGPRHALLILDNCEHVLAACVQFTAALLGAAPRLQVLATTRQALGMLGETVWRLPSLAVPPDGAAVDLPLPDLARLAAVRLFLERGRAVRPGFALTAGNRQAVAEVCRRLDGIPLAIELAAARLAVLSVDEVAARLADRFRLLVAGNGAALPRHRTLGAVIAWSYQLLTPAGATRAARARRILRRLDPRRRGMAMLGPGYRRHRRPRPAGAVGEQVAGAGGRRSRDARRPDALPIPGDHPPVRP